MRMKPDMPAGVQLSRQSRNRGLAGLTNYVETARKEVKKEWRSSGKGLSGQAARTEFSKEVSARADNLYKADVLLIKFGYNMADYTVNNVVQTGTSQLIQKQTEKRY